MKYRIFIFFIYLIFSKNITAQNLVQNGDFEFYSSCPVWFSEIYKAFPWNDPPTIVNSDYYNSCSTSSLTTVPNSGQFYQQTHSGDGYAGIAGFYQYGTNRREYLQGIFISDLIANSCYFAQLFINSSNRNGYLHNGFGVYISDTNITQTSVGTVLDFQPQITYQNIIIDSVNWVKMSGYYLAVGNENYITIGNYLEDNELVFDTIVNSFAYDGSYYYIDDVSIVLKLPSFAYSGEDKIIIKNDATIIGDTIEEQATYNWIPTIGLANPSSYQTIASPTETTTYVLTKSTPCGTSRDTVTVLVYENNYSFYPNPGNEFIRLNYTSESHAFLNVYDAIGRIVIENYYLPSGANQTVNFDFKHFSAGIYFFQLNDLNGVKIKSEKVIITK